MQTSNKLRGDQGWKWEIKYFEGIENAFVSVSVQASFTEYPTFTAVGGESGTIGHIVWYCNTVPGWSIFAYGNLQTAQCETIYLQSKKSYQIM